MFFAAYFIYASAVAAIRPIVPEMAVLVITLNVGLLLWFFVFSWGDRFRPDSYLGRIRDWFPIPLILLAYREMGWMYVPQPSQAFEYRWIRLDHVLLYNWGMKAAIESLGPVIPGVLEIAYLLVYAVPAIGVASLYLSGKRERVDDYYSVMLFAVLTSYAMYPWFPSEPPRSVFWGIDLPAYESGLRRLNLLLVGNYGIHTSVFPSGHAAAAFGSALALVRFLPERKWVGRRQMILAVLIAVATVYGRYHYAIDTLAGIALAIVGWLLTRLWRSQVTSSRTA